MRTLGTLLNALILLASTMTCAAGDAIGGARIAGDPGAALYATHCASCHGPSGAGAANGKPLTASARVAIEKALLIRNPSIEAHGIGWSLAPDDLQILISYIQSLAR